MVLIDKLRLAGKLSAKAVWKYPLRPFLLVPPSSRMDSEVEAGL